MLAHLVMLETLIASSSVESAAAALSVTEAELLHDLDELGETLGVSLVEHRSRPTPAASPPGRPGTSRAARRRRPVLGRRGGRGRGFGISWVGATRLCSGPAWECCPAPWRTAPAAT